MLFFVVCFCFALFPEAVLRGAQTGIALCINAVIPSLLPFMLASNCLIKSQFSRPLGAFLSKFLTPLTGMSKSGSVCFVAGIIGGYGTGAGAVYESFKQKQILRSEAERLLIFCNNAGPLFIMGTVGVGFFLSKSIGLSLFLVQILTALICARIFSGNYAKDSGGILAEWQYYKKNKPSIGELITSSAKESAVAILNVCVFVITFSAILEILPFGEYPFLSGFVEVTRGTAELSRKGMDALPFVSALIAWGGLSVHFQAESLTKGEIPMKKYYIGKVFSSIVAFFLTKVTGADINIILLSLISLIALWLVAASVKHLAFGEYIRQRGSRQQPHS